jgi:hypothetical protein
MARAEENFVLFQFPRLAKIKGKGAALYAAPLHRSPASLDVKPMARDQQYFDERPNTAN